MPGLKEQILLGLHQFRRDDMRFSYIVAAGLIVLGAAINLFVPHGWTVWPFVFVAAVMSMIHEAVQRAGQGIPPLHVYAFVVGILAIWIIAAVAFSVFNPIILLIGAIAISYQCAKGYLQEHERNRIIESRRSEGLCIYCAQPANPNHVYCDNCGKEPDPDNARLRRVAGMITHGKNTSRTRSVLTPSSPTTTAKSKEQALIARHHAATRRKH